VAASEDSLLPREHGAYGELAFPLLSALLAGSPRLAALAMTVGAVLAFLAHEPLLVWTGQRGPRMKREHGARALRRGIALGGAAAVLGLGAIATDPWRLGPAALVGVVLGVLGFGVALAGREKTAPGELLAATALSSAALPVGLAGGLSLAASIAIVVVWVASFGLGTAAARGVALRKKDGGRGLVIAGVATASLALACVGLAVAGLVPLRAALAPAPTILVALALVVRPVPVAQIRRVGWAMIAASAVTTAVLAAPLG
jgi:hypothetical protein